MENLQEKFTKFLAEEPFDKGQATGFARVGAPGGVPSVDDVVDGDAFNVQKPEMLQKLNAYLSSASATPVMNPYFLVNRIQTKLMEIGLTFDNPLMPGEVGSVEKPLKQFGGTYGYKPDAGKANKHGYPAITKTDGNSAGISIKFTWTCHKGLYNIDAELVYRASAPEPIGEDKKKDSTPLDEVSPPGWSGTTKAMKKHKEISNPFALAWYMKNKGDKSHKKPE